MNITPHKFYIIVCAILYIPGSLILIGNNYDLFQVLVLFICLSFSIVFSWMGWHVVKNIKINFNKKLNKILFAFLSCLFILSVIYMYQNTPPALFVLSDSLLAAEYRELATKGKSGIDSFLNGIYFALSNTILPILVLYSFKMELRFRMLYLFSSCLIILLSLEKGRLLVIILPLVFYFYFNNNHKSAIKYIGVAIISLFIISNSIGLTSEGLANKYNENFKERAIDSEDKMLFENPGTFQFIVNRIIWIPYITAIDWLKFNEVVLQDKKLYGQTIPLFYIFSGENERYRIENEIYKFQFNAGAESLGSSNSHFALDAYINFGILGVILYSLTFGMVLKFCWLCMPDYSKFLVFNYALSATVANLHSIFLGAGMIFILFWLFLNFLNGNKK